MGWKLDTGIVSAVAQSLLKGKQPPANLLNVTGSVVTRICFDAVWNRSASIKALRERFPGILRREAAALVDDTLDC